MFERFSMKRRLPWVNGSVIEPVRQMRRIVAELCDESSGVEHVGSQKQRVLVIETLENLRKQDHIDGDFKTLARIWE